MKEQRVALIIHHRLEIQVGRGGGLPAQIKALAIFRDVAEARKNIGAVVGRGVVLVIIFDFGFTPVAQMQIDIRPRARTARGRDNPRVLCRPPHRRDTSCRCPANTAP